MGRLSDDWKYDEIRPRPAKDREKAAKRIASMPYREAIIELEKLHSEFNINDFNDINRRITEKTKDQPDNFGVKVPVTEDIKGEDYEVVNDKSIDAIKDNITPPGAKGEKKMSKRMFSPDMLCPKCNEPMLYQAGGGKIKCYKCGNEIGGEELDNLDLYKSPHGTSSLEDFIPPGAESQKEELKDEIDTNDNGEIEVDEMADFQKSLDDYASKNKKGRDDIPVTTRR